ncbi:MAG: GNAT family N-acetyltransferase [Chloroflexota bacterium]|nr:GNAT family N-acetyltransferase [Chloroflexota bacterium]
MQERTAPELKIHPLTPRRMADLAKLFGQGGDPKWCWCAFNRVRGMTWANSTLESNRQVLADAVRTTAREHRAPGLVAYRGSEAVGWVSLGPREDYDRIQHSVVLAPLDDKPVWSIICFVVGKSARGQGVARALLDAAIAYARQHGATLLEAYPAETDGKRIPSASAYRGTVSMFERAGFEVVARRQFNKTTPVRPIVRRRVRKTG